jgi:hypothetical protein
VEKHLYDAASLERTLRVFEDRYHMSSADFYRAHVENSDTVASMAGAHRQAWAGFYCEWRRMSASGFTERAERELELA